MSASFSIVVPAFNSTRSLQEITEKAFAVLLPHDVEVIIVDDGSRPATWETIKKIKEQYGDRVKGVRLSKNFGQHNATLCGISYAVHPFVVTIDDDLQFEPKDILPLYQSLCENRSDIVYGIPEIKKQPLSRRAGYWAMSALAKLLKEEMIRASSFRLMKKQLAERLKQNERYYVNIDVLIRFYTDAVSCVQVQHHERKTSKSGYSYFGLIRLAMRTTFAYSAVPFKLFLVLFFLLLPVDLFLILNQGSETTFIFKTMMLLMFSASVLFFVFVLVYFYHLTGYMSNKPCYHVNEVI